MVFRVVILYIPVLCVVFIGLINDDNFKKTVNTFQVVK